MRTGQTAGSRTSMMVKNHANTRSNEAQIAAMMNEITRTMMSIPRLHVAWTSSPSSSRLRSRSGNRRSVARRPISQYPISPKTMTTRSAPAALGIDRSRWKTEIDGLQLSRDPPSHPLPRALRRRWSDRGACSIPGLFVDAQRHCRTLLDCWYMWPSVAGDAVSDARSIEGRSRSGRTRRCATRRFLGQKHAGSDSNTQPADLESAALPIELPASVRPIRMGREKSSPKAYFRLIL